MGFQIQKPLWISSTGTTNTISDLSIVSNDSLIVASDGIAHVLDRDGKILWGNWRSSSIAGNAVDSSIAIANLGEICLFEQMGRKSWCYMLPQHGETKVLMSQDGANIIAVSIETGWIYFFNKNGELLWSRYAQGSPIFSVSLSPDTNYIIIGAFDNRMISLSKDGTTKFIKQPDRGDEVNVIDSAISADGRRIVVGGIYANGGKVSVWTYTGGKRWEYITTGFARNVAISEDGSLVAVGDWNVAGDGGGNVYLLNNTGTVLWTRHLNQYINTLAMSQSGKYIVAGSGNTIYLFDIGGNLLWSYDTRTRVSNVALSQNESYIVAGTQAGKIYLFTTIPNSYSIIKESFLPEIYDANISDNYSWKYRIPIVLTERRGIDRRGEPVILKLSDIFGGDFNYSLLSLDSIRIVDSFARGDEPGEYGGNDVPFQISSMVAGTPVSGDDTLLFLSDVVRNSTKLYYLYYSDVPPIQKKAYPAVTYRTMDGNWNILPYNPSFEDGDEQNATYWDQYEGGYTRERGVARTGNYSIKLTGTPEFTGGLTALHLQSELGVPYDSVVISGWVKTVNMNELVDNTLSIYTDVYYHDDRSVYAITARFSGGSHDWQYSEVTIYPDAPIRGIKIHCFLDNRSGTAWFDDISVIPYAFLVETGSIEGIHSLNDGIDRSLLMAPTPHPSLQVVTKEQPSVPTTSSYIFVVEISAILVILLLAFLILRTKIK